MNYGWNYGRGLRSCENGVVTVYNYESGLLYRDGIFQRVLGAGRYRLWKWNRSRIDVLDVRRQTTQVANQKLLTSDQVTVTINISADYDFADVALSVHRVASSAAQLYSDLQLVARNIVGGVDVNTLLENRTGINAQLLAAVVPMAADYGLNVLSVAIKDVILAPKIRDLLLKEVEAKRVATAMLIGAREEVATLRALANAAQLIEKNPALLRLRELDVARSFAEYGSNTIVMGVGENAALVKSGTTGVNAKSDSEAE